MSRVGRKPIPLPKGVDVSIDGASVRVKGPKGELACDIPSAMRVAVADGEVVVTRPSDQKTHRAQHGLSRALINNMVVGVSEGFTKSLEIRGIGYRAELDGKSLVLRVGFSHNVIIKPPEGIDFEIDGALVHVRGIDKQMVGQQAAVIRHVRPPEPYKGKGIRYLGEWVRRKTGKGAITAT